MITIPITLRMLIAKYLCLLKPFWLRKNNKTSVLLIIIILAMILGVVKIQVWLNDWNNDFFNALSQKKPISFGSLSFGSLPCWEYPLY